MYYGKLEKLLKEICKKKSIDQHDLKKELIKKYISENVDLCEDKYCIKYGTEKDTKKDSVLIFGDDGEFYELSDGSRIQKEVFDKMYRTEESEIVINPNEFFGSTKIEIEEKTTPVDPKEFMVSSNQSNDTLTDFFKNLDTKKLKYTKDVFIKEHNNPWLDGRCVQGTSEKIKYANKLAKDKFIKEQLLRKKTD